MVLLTIKCPSGDEFLFETSCSSNMDDVIRDVALISNYRAKFPVLIAHVRELAAYGPMKPESERGYAESQIKEIMGDEKESSNEDPSGVRVGVKPSDEGAEILLKIASEADALLSKNQNLMGVTATVQKMQDCLSSIKGAVMISYPMGLPDFDTVRAIIEDRETFSGHAVSKDLVDPTTCLLWFCGKHMGRNEKLSKFSGNNEKTKITAKLTKKGASAPAREPTVDAETQKNMMAAYQKRQNEMKRLEEEDDEGAYLNSEWANPKGLKSSFTGVGNIKWKGGF